MWPPSFKPRRHEARRSLPSVLRPKNRVRAPVNRTSHSSTPWRVTLLGRGASPFRGLRRSVDLLQRDDLLRDEAFLVISGDALTDIDLTELVRFHKDNGAMVTVGLTRVPDPLEFGIIIVDDDGRIQRFLEKPTWGQVFSDTVNTGVYVMEPEVLSEFPAGESADWSGDIFPQLLKRGAPLYGWIADGYWEDVGTHESYLKAQADVLSGRVQADIDGFEVSPGVWVADGAEVDPEAILTGPLCIGDYAKIEAGAQLREYTVVGSNVVVKEGAFLHRAVVHNNVYVGP